MMWRTTISTLLDEAGKLMRWAANELDPTIEQPNDEPPQQYPVGTLWYQADGTAWQLQTSGQWTSVEEDGEPLDGWQDRLTAALDNYYEGIYAEDDDEVDAGRVADILEDLRNSRIQGFGGT